jgi:hypothetical protein
MYYGYYNNVRVCYWDRPPTPPWVDMCFEIDGKCYKVESVSGTDVYLKLG